MKTRICTAMAACLLLLTGCSSANDEASDEAFCSALEDWSSLLDDTGYAMDELGSSMSDSEDLQDLPTPDELHSLGLEIVTKATEADAAMAIIAANTTDPDVAKTLKAGHDLIFTLSLWMGEAARDSETIWDFVATIGKDMDRMSQFDAEFNELDGDSVNEYISATCGDLNSFFGGSSDQ